MNSTPLRRYCPKINYEIKTKFDVFMICLYFIIGCIIGFFIGRIIGNLIVSSSHSTIIKHENISLSNASVGVH
uniref:Uncharacterized protein n=2 Tax=Meloidogyne TaxID=189290 RepID=A0A914MDB0_MELIC|nr:unnamed protein product [Meloidogyne enterolobii]